MPCHSDSESDSESVTQEYLDSLIAKAKAAAVNKRQKIRSEEHSEDEVILLDAEEDQKCVYSASSRIRTGALKGERRLLPSLDPGPSLPRPYFNLGTSRTEVSSLLHDLDAESIRLSAPSQPSAPPPPSELNRDGKPMTKRQIKEVYISC